MMLAISIRWCFMKPPYFYFFLQKHVPGVVPCFTYSWEASLCRGQVHWVVYSSSKNEHAQDNSHKVCTFRIEHVYFWYCKKYLKWFRFFFFILFWNNWVQISRFLRLFKTCSWYSDTQSVPMAFTPFEIFWIFFLWLKHWQSLNATRNVPTPSQDTIKSRFALTKLGKLGESLFIFIV